MAEIKKASSAPVKQAAQKSAGKAPNGNQQQSKAAPAQQQVKAAAPAQQQPKAEQQPKKSKPATESGENQAHPARKSAPSLPAPENAPKNGSVGHDLVIGTVKWFSATRGYGFITPGDGSPEIFVHQSCIHADGFRSLQDGETVEFTVEAAEDGRFRAMNVTGPNGAYVRGDAGRGENPAPNRQPRTENGTGSGRGGGGGRRGRGGRGGSGNGGNFNGARCFNCNQPGHFARECNASRDGCYNCGEQGHFARDCPNQA